MSEPESPGRKMDRSQVNVIRQGTDPGNNYVPGTMEYRLGLVWPMTCEVASLCEHMDVEQPLQRNIVVIRRGWLEEPETADESFKK